MVKDITGATKWEGAASKVSYLDIAYSSAVSVSGTTSVDIGKQINVGVSKKGYIYSYDDFKSNCINFRNRIGIDGESSFFVAHYRSYIENENYVLVSLLVGRRQGGLYDNAISAEYTLIKSGNSYRILDFSYPDFDLYAYKFREKWEYCCLMH